MDQKETNQISVQETNTGEGSDTRHRHGECKDMAGDSLIDSKKRIWKGIRLRVRMTPLAFLTKLNGTASYLTN